MTSLIIMCLVNANLFLVLYWDWSNAPTVSYCGRFLSSSEYPDCHTCCDLHAYWSSHPLHIPPLQCILCTCLSVCPTHSLCSTPFWLVDVYFSSATKMRLELNAFVLRMANYLLWMTAAWQGLQVIGSRIYSFRYVSAFHDWPARLLMHTQLGHSFENEA